MTTPRPIPEVRKGFVSQYPASSSPERPTPRSEPAWKPEPDWNPVSASLDPNQTSQAALPVPAQAEALPASEHLRELRRLQAERIGSGIAKWVFGTSLLLAVAATVAMLLMLIAR